MKLTDLAPWELLGYFQLPVETYIPAVNAGQQILAPNNMRWGFLFQPVNVSGNVYISTKSGLTGAGGINIYQNTPPTILTCRDHGPLPTLGWYCGLSAMSCTVIELILQSWPDESNMPGAAIQHPVPPQQSITLPSAPGVGGQQGVISYWQKLMSRIKGG